jgi:putative spermidine/putrescine transport system substrate-binding protein
MKRRQFLKTIPAAIALPTLTGCQSIPQNALLVTALKGTIPAQLPKQFNQANPQANPIALTQERQLATLFQQLQAWKRRSLPDYSPKKGLIPLNVPFIGTSPEVAIAHLITLGDVWLSTAIRQGLIRSIDPANIPQFNSLDPTLKTLLKRNDQGHLDPNGSVWAVPYRINSTVILYRQDKFKQYNLKPPTDWVDLWRSDLTGKISLLNSPIEVIGLTLKKLGKSYNIAELPTELAAELVQLHRQVKLYSSTHYLQPLTLDHTWVALANSTDALQMIRRNPTLAAVFPTSGTLLSADLWVQPNPAAVNPDRTTTVQTTITQTTIADWCNYCLRPDLAPQLSQLSQGMAPLLNQTPADRRPEELRTNPILTPSTDAFTRSEYLTPKTDAQLEQWRSAWEKMRKG